MPKKAHAMELIYLGAIKLKLSREGRASSRRETRSGLRP